MNINFFVSKRINQDKFRVNSVIAAASVTGLRSFDRLVKGFLASGIFVDNVMSQW